MRTRMIPCGLVVAGWLLIPACGSGGPPTLDPIPDQTLEVGVEATIEIAASDPDGDPLVFRVFCETLPDLTSRAHPPTFVPFGASSAYLRFTPVAGDVGTHTFTVSASDGAHTATRSFSVQIVAGSAVPVFREPLGSGTTLDLSQESCVELDVVVDDPDSPQVDVYLDDPIEDGYTFSQDDPSAGIFSWCPSQKQIDGSERYTVNFVADDRSGHVARKKYVILLRRELGSQCPGQPPTIAHSPPAGTQSTVLNIPVTATMGDDQGLAGFPALYYSLSPPLDPAHPDFGQFVQLQMRRVSGDALSGQYQAEIPNPVLEDPVGTQKTVYYFLEATDDDDAEGTCDHRTTAPEGDVYQVVVERPAGGSGLGPCAACLADVQCDSGRCVALGAGDEANCLEPCQSPGAPCGAGGTCSQSAWTSVDGASGLVCLPPGSSCQAACVDDVYEDNDSIDDPNVQALDPGHYVGLQLCGDGVGGDDEDFFGILLDQSSLVTATLLFSQADGDIDLKLLDEDGATLATSWSVTDNEQISECLQPGLYFLRVFSFDSDINAPYDLVLTVPPEGCCVDDTLEENDGALEAMPVLPGDFLTDLTICPDDEDWFAIDAPADASVIVDLLFDQNDPNQDLDVYLYGRDGSTNLTPCCDLHNGQSATSDEHLEYRVSVAGTYYVVVNGYDGSSNAYYIGFDVVQ